MPNVHIAPASASLMVRAQMAKDPLAFKIGLNSASPEYGWFLAPNNRAFYERVGSFLETQGNPEETIPFCREAVGARYNGGSVDFVDGLIVNITDECQKEVIIEGMDNCSALSALVLGVFGGNYDIDYVVEKANLGPNTTASTSNIVQYNSITKKCFLKITIDSNYLTTATDLSIARTTAHESFHAALTFMVMEGMFVHNGSPDSNFGNLMNGFVDYLETNNNDQYEGAQHDIL